MKNLTLSIILTIVTLNTYAVPCTSGNPCRANIIKNSKIKNYATFDTLEEAQIWVSKNGQFISPDYQIDYVDNSTEKQTKKTKRDRKKDLRSYLKTRDLTLSEINELFRWAKTQKTYFTL